MLRDFTTSPVDSQATQALISPIIPIQPFVKTSFVPEGLRPVCPQLVTWQHRLSATACTCSRVQARYRSRTLCQQPFTPQATQRNRTEIRGNCRARRPSSESPMAANPCALGRRSNTLGRLSLLPLISLTDNQGWPMKYRSFAASSSRIP